MPLLNIHQQHLHQEGIIVTIPMVAIVLQLVYLVQQQIGQTQDLAKYSLMFLIAKVAERLLLFL